MTQNRSQGEDFLLEQLRSILLEEERVELRRLENMLNDPDQLSDKVAPIMEQRLDTFKKSFPKEYKVVVNKLIEERLKNSQDQIVEIIYPMLGNMVRKFIEHQFQMLKESVEQRLRETQEQLNLWKRVKRKFSPNSGITGAELVLTSLSKPSVEEIYLVERESGLLLAHAAREENLDRDSVAGMLTAIKAFVVDAFRKEQQELDFVAYENHKLLIQNYRSYYIAALIQGSVSAKEREILSGKLYDFILKEYVHIQHKQDDGVYQHISGLLEANFIQSSVIAEEPF